MQDNNNNNEELEFNRINRETSEKIMKAGSYNRDMYWDIHNPFVIIVLIILGAIIILGFIFYLLMFANS